MYSKVSSRKRKSEVLIPPIRPAGAPTLASTRIRYSDHWYILYLTKRGDYHCSLVLHSLFAGYRKIGWLRLPRINFSVLYH